MIPNFGPAMLASSVYFAIGAIKKIHVYLASHDL